MIKEKIDTKGIWKIVDANKYRYGIDETDRNKSHRNSLTNNQHTFNRAKFFKLNLHRLEELKGYDIVVWLDGTIEIINPDFIKFGVEQIKAGNNIIVFEHNKPTRNGSVYEEVKESHWERYTSTKWMGQDQPYQNVDQQYNQYLKNGFKEHWFKDYNIPLTENYGLYITCMIFWDMKRTETIDFLNSWWNHNLMYTTQDQISFPYLLWEKKIYPFVLPRKDLGIEGNGEQNTLYVKWNHQ